MTALTIVLIWLVLSVPLALLLGAAIRLADRMESRPLDADRYEDWAA